MIGWCALSRSEMTKPPANWSAASYRCGRKLDRLADRAQRGADLGAKEDERDDRHDRDEREDQRVLGETLAFLVTIEKAHDGKINRRHRTWYLLSEQTPRRIGGAPRYEGRQSLSRNPMVLCCVWENNEPPDRSIRRFSVSGSGVTRLDRLPDGAEGCADLLAQEDEGDDGDDGDEREDQRVLGEALAFRGFPWSC